MRIALISSRYGAGIAGGAEALGRGLLETLAARGHEAEVWTTCAKDHQTWTNYFPSGSEIINGVFVRRFAVDPWNSTPFDVYSANLLTRGYLPIEEQFAWVESGPSSAALYTYTAENQADFDIVVVIPVVNTIIFKAAWLALERLILWPCLHDEIFAYLAPIRGLMEKALGIIFNSPEEQDLVIRKLKLKLARSAVIGSGVVSRPSTQPAHPNGTPYLLYVGRLEEGKNLPILIEYITRYAAEGHDLKLKIAGTGNYALPGHPAVEYLGYIDEQDKVAFYAQALALCQPSLNESFSLTMMESWLAGRPALVHKNCAVTRGHVQRARAGLWFETYGEFRGALDWLLSHQELAGKMGQNGRAYVQMNYTWPIVAERFMSTLEQWRRDW